MKRLLTKDIRDIRGFDDAFMEMYDGVHVKMYDSLVNQSSTTYTKLHTTYEYVEDKIEDVDRLTNNAFEKMYNVKLSQRGITHHFLYTFDTVEFKSEADLTMFVLKWS
jgi:hypothetical protein